MTAVISLLSSSPLGSPELPKVNLSTDIRRGVNLTRDDPHLFDVSDVDDDRPSKKRRMSDCGRSSPSVSRVKVLPRQHKKDASSDLEDLSRLLKSSKPGRPQSRPRKIEFGVDFIEFESSVPQPRSKNIDHGFTVYDLSDDDESNSNDEFLLTLSQATAQGAARHTLSERTTSLLATIDNKTLVKAGPKLTSKTTTYETIATNESSSKFKLSKRGKSAVLDDIVVSSPPKASPKKRAKSTKLTEEEKVGKAAKRAAARADKISEREAEKEAEKAKKRAEKDRLAKEKQKAADIAEVNKSKINKKDSVTEVIVDMEGSLQGTSVGTQVEEFMKQLQVQTTYFDEEVVLDEDNPIDSLGSIIRWRRKIEAIYNEDMEIWEPAPEVKITSEKHALVYLKATEFACILAGPRISSTTPLSEVAMKTNMDAYVRAIRDKYPDHTLIYLIEGLVSWLKRNHNAKNREFTAAVRAQASVEELESTLPSTSQPNRRRSKKSKAPTTDLSFITKAHTDAIQIHLHLSHQPLLIHHTTSTHTTAAQISSFTQHLSTRPYRLAQQKHNLQHASFCMDTGQIRTGDNAEDTWIRMLQEIQRVTPSMAYGIRDAGYGSVRELVAGFRKDGREMLSEVKKSMNKDGAWSDRRLGVMVSKRLCKVFLGRDPESMDGVS